MVNATLSSITNNQGTGSLRMVLLFLAVLLPFGAGAEPALRVIYGSPARQLDSVDLRYPLQLLREALQASGEPFVLQRSV